MTQTPFHVVFAIFDQITQLDFTGPAQFLCRMPGAQVHVAAATLDPVMTDVGFAIVPTTTFADCPQADLLCVPGGLGVAPALSDARLIDFVRNQAAEAQWVTSVCTGAFILGAAGLLYLALVRTVVKADVLPVPNCLPNLRHNQLLPP